jgi:hypothetical protein
MKNYNNSFFYLLLITAAILLCVRPAHASGTVTVAPYYDSNVSNINVIGHAPFSSVGAANVACGTYYNAYQSPYSGYSCTNVGPTAAVNNVYFFLCGNGASCAAGSSSAYLTYHAGTGCPANSTLSGGSCTCNATYIAGADGHSCVLSSTCPAVGAQTSSGWYDDGHSGGPAGSYGGWSPPTTACDGGCSSSYVGGSSGGYCDLIAGVEHCYAFGAYQSQNLTCSGGSGAGANSNIPPSTCPAGQVLETNPYGYICAIPGVSGSGSGTSAGSASAVPAVSSGGASSGSVANVGTSSTTSTASTNASGVTTTTTSGTFTVNIPPTDVSQLETHADALAQTAMVDTHIDLTTLAVNQGASSVVAAINNLAGSGVGAYDLNSTDLAIVSGVGASVSSSYAAPTGFVSGLSAAANPVSEPSYLREFITPFQSVACNSASWTFSALGTAHTMTVDPCPYMSGYQNFITWVFYIITAFGIFFVVMEVPRTTAGG